MQSQLESALDWVSTGGSVLLFGPSRAGKSAALGILANSVPDARVLSCNPEVNDHHWPFSGIVSLLSSVSTDEMNSFFSARQDAASKIAVTTHPVNGNGNGRARHLDRFAASVSTAASRLIGLLALTGPVVLLLDDAKLLDRASTEVLKAVASGAHGAPVQVVAAERVEPGKIPTRQSLCPEPVLILHYGPALL